MQDAGSAVQRLWLRWPCLPLPALPAEALEGVPAVAAHNGQQSATPQLSAEYRCAECAGPIEGKRRGAKFCSDSCRVKSAGKAFRERKRAMVAACGVARLSDTGRPWDHRVVAYANLWPRKTHGRQVA
jgi:hypothetical protein